MAKDYQEEISYDSTGEPVYKRTYWDGEEVTMTGDKARANYSGSADDFRKENPLKAWHNRYTHPDDMRNTWSYKAGLNVRDWINGIGRDKSFLGTLMEQGALPGGIVGGIGGLGAGLVGNFIASKFMGSENPHLGLLGLLAGGALGAYMGHNRAEAANGNALSKVASVKEAAMFHDPRNFILERLAAANDVGRAAKVELAYKVRNLSPEQARRLADAIRASMSFGVGAIIGKFLGTGSIVGGVGGLLGVTALRMLTTPGILR